MKIQVTQEDIDNGERRTPRHCPVALATSRILGKEVSVGTTYIIGIHEDDTKDEYYLFPPFVRRFIESFDKGKEVLPIEFEIKQYAFEELAFYATPYPDTRPKES